MNDIKERVARGLLAIGAVFLRPEEPFTWASGIKSPIYCDNRLILTAPDVRNEVEAAIAETVRREFPEAEALMGTATAGIAHAAIAAHLMGLPMGYVRSGAKDHGRQNRIEGKLTEGEKVVVIEDLISTGGSLIETVEALREAGADVLGAVSIFTYGMEKGKQRLAEAKVRAVSLTDFDEIVAVAEAEGGEEVVDYAGDRQAGQILDPPAVGRIREDHHSEHRDQDACSRQTRAEDHAPPPGCTIYGCGQMADDGIGSDGTLVRRRAPHKASPPRSMRSGFSDPPVKDSKGTTVHVP